MIRGTGIDLVSIARMAHAAEKAHFVSRVFTASERAYAEARGNAPECYAGMFAAKEAAAKAIQSPLLEAQISGAKSAIVNVTGGPNITIYDSSIAVDYIREAAGNDIEIIYGVAINDDIGENIIVTVIATLAVVVNNSICA